MPVPPSDHDVARYTRYDEWIHQAATLYQIPEQLVRAVIRCESDYDPRAVSVSGARGLMQLMPDTATLMQVRDIDDPRENIFGGVRLLRILANEFNGDLELTIAAYNAGDGVGHPLRRHPTLRADARLRRQRDELLPALPVDPGRRGGEPRTPGRGVRQGGR